MRFNMVKKVGARVAALNLGRYILTMVVYPPWMAGWVLGKICSGVWLGLSWVVAAVQEGWVSGMGRDT